MATRTKKQDTNGEVKDSVVLEETPDIRSLEIPKPGQRFATLRVEWISSLIQNRFSEKARKAMEDAQTGKARGQRTARNPEEEGLAAAYVVPGREEMPHGTVGKYYHPGSAFRHAWLYGIAQLSDIKKFPQTKASGWLFVDSDPILEFDRMVVRSDPARISGTMTITYRPEFFDWALDLDISYNSNTITPEQIVSIFDLGGMGGIGEWRPTSPKNKSGDHGRFRVVGFTER